MSCAQLLPTFRDPQGSLRLEGDSAIRTVTPAARDAALEFVTSAFSQRLQLHGDMIGTIVEDDGARLVHPRVAVPSYPWEWTPAQWLAAAELTLRLCSEGLEGGWILKDATPLNILFVGARPVLVDVLSFERRDEKKSIWLAYGQYLRTFLLPLLMNKMLGWPLSLSLLRRDGLEPSELYAAMSWRQRLSAQAFWPITLPAWLERRKGTESARPAVGEMDPEAATHVLQQTLKSLRKRAYRIQRAMSKVTRSEWSEYQKTLTHYSAEESAAKQVWVRRVLEEAQASRVLDVGANTGEFSSMAAELGAEVVALERDAAAADRLYRMSRERGLNILTLNADLARPTPAAGWENAEQSSLLDRLEGQFEMVMLLAVIHHLILMEQIPLEKILALCARLTKKHLIVEWVPVSDPMYQSLMRGRDELYGALTEADLLTAAAAYFHLVRQQALSNGRMLFLLELLPGMG